jgi:HlyD family secretion protein
MTQARTDISLLAGGSTPPPDNGSPSPPARGVVVPIPRRRWKTRVLLPGMIFAAVGLTLLLAAGDALWPATPVHVVPVVVKAGVQTAGKIIVQAPGWVEADPFPVAVTALADGIVADVPVLEGQHVEANEVVARLIPTDAQLALAKAEATLAEAKAGLFAAEADLKAAQRDWDTPIELTRQLSTAEAELAEKQAELARWPAELAADEALAQFKEAEYLRVKPLYESGTASNIEYVRVQKEYENQKAVAEATRGRQPIIAAQITALQAEVKAAREHLELRINLTKMLENGQAAVAKMTAGVAAAQAARDEAQLRLERMDIRAPVAGVVMNRLVAPGSKLMLNSNEMQSAQVLRLYDPARLQVRVDIPLAEAAKVGVGQQAEVVVDVLPERTFKGHVTRIVNEADIQKNTLQVKVAIEEPDAAIKPEMLARARFFANADAGSTGQAQRLLLPESVVMRHAGGHTMVWVADQARQIAVPRTITIAGMATDGWVQVDTGIQPGDRVIADAPNSLRDGSRIRILGEVAGDAAPTAQGASHGAHRMP